MNKFINSMKLTKRDFMVFGVNFVLIFVMVILQHLNLKTPEFVTSAMSIIGIR
jgi:hypothetical protein